MITYSRELQKPKSEAEFEDMCVIVYGDVFSDPLAKLNGRRGQNQGGVDAYIKSAGGRIGVQSKRYKDGSLKLKHIEDEITKAEAHPVKIITLIVATTAANDANLAAQVMALSDEREAAGKFTVQVDFWDDIRLRIARSPMLQRLYDPFAPGALFHQVAAGQDGLAKAVALISQDIQSLKSPAFDTALPGPLPSSIANVFTRQIDSVKDLLEATRYREANDRLEMLAGSFDLLDAHQKARWHVQRGVCRVHLFAGQGAAEDFIAAYGLFPQDEKIAAAGIRGLALQHNYDKAIEVGTKSVAHWPASVDVWTALAFAKVESGQQISADDVPPEMASERRVLSLLCWSALEAKQNDVAAEYGQKLLALPDPTLPEKTAAFTAALLWATENPFERDHGFIKREAKDALTNAIAGLEPRADTIWRNQSLASLPGDASNLAYAYYLLDRYEDVLATCAEAAAHMPLPDRMISLKLVTLKALDRIDELLELVPRYIGQIERTAVAPIAEVASWRGRDDLIIQLAERVGEDDDGYDRQTIVAFAALAKLNSGRRKEAFQVVDEIHCEDGKHLGATIVAARVLLAAGEKERASARLEEVLASISVQTSAEIKLMAADCLFFLKRYREAAKFYAPYCAPEHYSVLHSRLFRSYMESGQRAKARALQASFPAEWVDDDDARETAILLAQRAADWQRLLDLANHQMRMRPKSTGSWLLRILAERYGGSKHNFVSLIADLPEELKGSVRQQAQLAVLELQHGRSDAGVRRLYRMMRSNMQDPSAASAYMTCMYMLASSKQLDGVVEVGVGTSVKLRDDTGAESVVNIDMHDMEELPPHVDFQAPNSYLSNRLLSKHVGERIEIPGQLGATRIYTIVEIVPVALRLLHALHDRVNSSPEGLPSIWSVNLQREDGKLDLSEMQAMLDRNGQRTRNVFDTYASNPITLGVCAKVLGISVLELVQGWPIDASPLRVCAGDHEERNNALQLLEKIENPFVIDLATLGEIVALDCAPALSALSKPYVSSAAVQILEGLIEGAVDDRSFGRAVNIDGQLRIVEYDEEFRSSKLRYLERIKRAVEEHCIVQPTYGSGELPDSLTELEELLGDDEYEALLLAKELGAVLISMDQVLRQFAADTIGIQGVWPQALLASAGIKGILAADRYRFAVQMLFRSNRSFVAVDSEDILMMCRQGGMTLQTGLEKVRTVFQAASSDALSCTEVIEGVIRGMMGSRATLGVVRELVEYLYEPLFRHPAPLPDLEFRAQALMQRISKRFAVLPPWFPFASELIKDQDTGDTVYRYLMAGVRIASQRAAAPMVARPFPFFVTKVTVVPELRAIKP